MNVLDENDRLRGGTLPHDPFADASPFAPDDDGPADAGDGTKANWDDPIPFDDFDLPSFPVDLLPSWLKTWSQEEATALQVPIDLPALLGLSVVSLCISKRIVVAVRDDWYEPTNVYAAIVLPSGEGKTPVFQHAISPVLDWEATERRRMRPVIAEAEERARQVEERAKHLRQRAARSKNGAEREQLERELRKLSLDASSVPRAPRLIASDATPEAVGQLLAEQGGRLGILSDEGGPFEIMGGRYSEGRANFELFLQGYSGSPYALDRVKRPSISLRAPAITMALTVQPSVIAGLASEPRFRGRGLLARFIYALPRSKVGFRDANPSSMSPATRAAYESAIGVLIGGDEHRDADGEIVSRAVPMTSGARDELFALRAKLEPRLGPAGDLRDMADWTNKLAGTVARLAALLHVAERCDGDIFAPIDHVTIEKAIAIGADYAIDHARAAFGLMGADPATGLAKRLLAWALSTETRVVTKRDAQRALHVPRAAELDPAFALLVERSYLRPVETEPTGGRPRSPTYEINPRAKWGQK